MTIPKFAQELAYTIMHQDWDILTDLDKLTALIVTEIDKSQDGREHDVEDVELLIFDRNDE